VVAESKPAASEGGTTPEADPSVAGFEFAATYVTQASVKSPLTLVREPRSSKRVVQQWLQGGLLRRSEATKNQDPPANVLTIEDGLTSQQNVTSVTAALQDLGNLDLPPLQFMLRTSHPQIIDLSADLVLSPDVAPEVSSKIVDVLKSRGIPTTIRKRPTISLWLIRSRFDSLDEKSKDEVKSVFKEMGLESDESDSDAKRAAAILFSPDAAVNYDRDRASSLLAWLKAKGLVLQVTTAKEASTDRVEQAVGSSGAGYGNEVHVTRSHSWSWSAVPDTSDPETWTTSVARQLSEREQWRGEAGPRSSTVLEGALFNFSLAPGRVAILRAFPGKAVEPAVQVAAEAANKGNYLPLLVVENHVVDGKPDAPIGASDNPRFLAPDGAAPVKLLGREGSAKPAQLKGLGTLLAAAPQSGAATFEATAEVQLSGTTTSPSSDPLAKSDSKPAAKKEPHLKIFPLQHAPADTMASLLSQVVRSNGFTAVADARTNSLVITAPGEELEIAETLLSKLDRPGAKTAVAFARSGSSTSQSAEPKPATSKAVGDLERAYADREAAAAKLAAELKELQKSASTGKDDPRQASLRDKLKAAVRQSFEARQALLSAELESLQSRIDSTRQTLELRGQASEVIVDRRVDDLLNPDLDWDAQRRMATAPMTGWPVQVAEPPQMPSLAPAASPRAAGGGGFFAPGPVPAFPGAESYRGFQPSLPAGKGGGAAGAASGQSNPFAARSAETKQRTLSTSGLNADQLQEAASELGLKGDVMVDAFSTRLKFEATDEKFRQLDELVRRRAAQQQAEEQDRAQVLLLSQLTGIWRRERDDHVLPDPSQQSVPVPQKLAIDGGRAALFEKNERKRSWTIRVEEVGLPARLTFDSDDGQGGMQASYDQNNNRLSVVSLGEDGATIEVYLRSISAVPPEWAAEMQKGAAKPVDTIRSSDQLRSNTTGALRSRSRAERVDEELTAKSRWARMEQRNPSDYLELLGRYQKDSAEYERRLQSLAPYHPEVQGLKRDRDFQLKAIDLIRLEFQAEIESASRTVELKRKELAQALIAYEFGQRLVEKGAATQTELRKQQAAVDAARTDLEEAESRLILFSETKASLFPEDSKPARTPGSAKGAGEIPAGTPPPDEFGLPKKAPPVAPRARGAAPSTRSRVSPTTPIPAAEPSLPSPVEAAAPATPAQPSAPVEVPVAPATAPVPPAAPAPVPGVAVPGTPAPGSPPAVPGKPATPEEGSLGEANAPPNDTQPGEPSAAAP
ncbi:MAG TPA: secretin N-terminal domain-containing protein, partial [Caulifigura sp.]|nr:secretin N-terminal domain-containing protein [Caulifigura sp.]